MKTIKFKIIKKEGLPAQKTATFNLTTGRFSKKVAKLLSGYKHKIDTKTKKIILGAK